MGKLHELLAVEGDLEGVAKKVVDEASVTFTKKGEHFQGFHKTLQMLDDERQHEEAPAEERRELVTTVQDKLDYVSDFISEWWDAVLQKEATNQKAKATVLVDGLLLEDLPATFLLGMETKLKNLRNLYTQLPTLPPGTEWVEDSDQGENIFRAKHPQLRKKEEKQIAHKVLYEATPDHPAQIEKWTENRVVGTYTTNYWMGMVTPARKSEMLKRIDLLIKAFKKARQRANTTEVMNVNVAKKIMDFIHR